MLLLMLAEMFSHTHDVFARLMLCVCYVQDLFRRLGDGPPVLRRLRCMHILFCQRKISCTRCTPFMLRHFTPGLSVHLRVVGLCHDPSLKG